MPSIPEDAPEVPMEGCLRATRPAVPSNSIRCHHWATVRMGCSGRSDPGLGRKLTALSPADRGGRAGRCSRGIDATGSALCCVYP
jgi:hypothetical protein